MRRIIKRGDVIVAIFVLIIAIVIALFFASGQPRYVVIYVDGSEYARYILDDTTKEIDIETEYGYNSVKISDGSVCVTEASCQDKLDIKAGSIYRNGQSIVCLPNRVVVSIEGGTKTDATAF